ncbi:MAG: hypothetical protein JNJ83_05610 [Verrucomicrobiaceae bacterium]|nr:hypothetical protein [Verrucomicrobiaceae bacterium]
MKGLSLLGFLCVLSASAADKLTTRSDEVGKLLNEWHAEGRAAGLKALQYENRDGGHAPFQVGMFPGLKSLVHDEKERGAGRHMGPAHSVRRVPTLGNCSMASTADTGGCLPRIYLMSGNPGFNFLDASYRANNFIIYPEHQDHDVGFNGVDGWGDLFPANHPAVLISQGSSLSDLPFVQAWLSTVAAFTPEVQELLIAKGVLMPTVNMIFRRSNKQVRTDEDYFSGLAHPVVFDAKNLDEKAMVNRAQLMTPLTIPPVAMLEVLEERKPVNGVDYFEKEGVTEQLGQSASSVGRIFRGVGEVYSLRLSARRSVEIQGKPMKARWVLLQGRKDKVEIKSSADGTEAEIRVLWHDDMESASGTGIKAHRVDVGLFVSSPLADSAPAIVSVFMLPNEKRYFNDGGKVSEVCYQAHNEDLGIPRASEDMRWLQWMRVVAGEPLPGERWVRTLINDEARSEAKIVLGELQPMERALAELKTRKAPAEDIANMEKKLKAKLAGAADLRALAEKVVRTFANDPRWFLNQQAELIAVAAAASDAAVIGDVRAGIKKLTDMGVLVSQGDGGYVLAGGPTAAESPAVADYLRGLHLMLLSRVVLPEFLHRSNQPAFCDPRLTALKPWRDVYRYDEKGKLLGWLRHQEGRVHGFTADGRMKLNLGDPDEKAVPVKYEMKGGRLVFGP